MATPTCPLQPSDSTGLEVLPFLTFILLLVQLLADGAFSISNNNNNNNNNNDNNDNNNNNVNAHDIRNNNKVENEISTSTIVIGGRGLEASSCGRLPQRPHTELDVVRSKEALLRTLNQEGQRIPAGADDELTYLARATIMAVSEFVQFF